MESFKVGERVVRVCVLQTRANTVIMVSLVIDKVLIMVIVLNMIMINKEYVAKMKLIIRI